LLQGVLVVTRVDFERPGPWRELWPHALGLMSHLEAATASPEWTFGGGTVLMLRHDHRFSKDIDLFVRDPQYLGHVNPRLGGFAEGLTSEYEESAEYIKLQLAAGEIDVVVGEPLTERSFDIAFHDGRQIRVETSAEIIAKKMWHRGDQAKARDLFDLCAVATFEPEAIEPASPFMARHAAAFLERLERRAELAEAEFEQIEARSFKKSFWECLLLAQAILGPG
jgi:hypothetical protein